MDIKRTWFHSVDSEHTPQSVWMRFGRVPYDESPDYRLGAGEAVGVPSVAVSALPAVWLAGRGTLTACAIRIATCKPTACRSDRMPYIASGDTGKSAPLGLSSPVELLVPEGHRTDTL